MSLRSLVHRFYGEIWNEQRLDLVDEVLAPAVTFRGSLGGTRTGRHEFCEYAREVTTALADYRCTIESLVVENDSAAARLTFSGIHVARFLDRPPTGQRVTWAGAAFFHVRDGVIDDIWVLGDLVNLFAQLDGQPTTLDETH